MYPPQLILFWSMNTCTYTYTYTYYTRLYTYLNTHTHIHTYTYIHTRMYPPQHIYIHIHAYIHTYTHVPTSADLILGHVGTTVEQSTATDQKHSMSVCVFVCVCVCVRACVCVCACVFFFCAYTHLTTTHAPTCVPHVRPDPSQFSRAGHSHSTVAFLGADNGSAFGDQLLAVSEASF